MIAFWSRLSVFTRILAVVVFLAAVTGAYTRLRFQPQRDHLAATEKIMRGLRADVRTARERVGELEQEALLAQRWSRFATILEDQSTGRSLRDVVRTCGTEGGPDVTVEKASFDRRTRGASFARMGVSLRVRGSYGELIRLLDELDRAFPPIEITKASLDRPDGDRDPSDSDVVVADLEGVIHETR